MSLVFDSRGPEDTEALGFLIGSLAQPGLIVTLKGDLGAGKTLMTKGIARGLGVDGSRYVTSPTFTIHKVYQGRLTLDHMDFYRLGGEEELGDLGFEDTLGGDGVSVIEWPDRFFAALGPDRLDVDISILSGDGRKIRVSWGGPVASAVGEGLRLFSLNDGRK